MVFTLKPSLNKQNRIYFIISVAACTLCIAPFILLSIYVHPNAEDYSHSFLPRYSSSFFFVFDFFKNKEARLFTNLLYAVNPLRFDMPWAYKLIGPVLLCGLFTALYFFIKSFSPFKLQKQTLSVLSLLITGIFLGLTPSPVHALYWMSSSFNYTTSLILLLFLSVAVYSTVKDIRSGAHLKKRKIVLTVLLLYALVLSNEIFIFSPLFLLGILFLRAVYTGLPERHFYVMLFITQILASLIYFIPHLIIPDASHDVIRPDNMPVMAATLLSVQSTLLNLLKWSLLNPPLLIFSVFLFLYIRYFTENALKPAQLPRIRSLLFYSGGIIIFMILWLVPYYIFRGFEHIPQRIFNMQYFIFIPLWLYVVACGAWSRPATGISVPYKPGFISMLLMAVAFSVTLLSAPNTVQAYSDLLGGKAAAYDREIVQRLAEFKRAHQSKERVAHTEVLRNRPFTIYFPPELEADSCRNIWNTAYENYFNLVEIHVTDTLQVKKTP